MTMELSMLSSLFDPLPEAVFFLDGNTIAYRNPSASALLPEDSDTPDILSELLPNKNGELVCSYKAQLFRISVSVLDADKRLLILRPLREAEPISISRSIPAQLRGHLSNLAVTTEQLSQRLAKENRLEDYHTLLTVQNQATYRILRLTRQLELAPDDWEVDFSRDPLDFTCLCRTLLLELSSRLDDYGPKVKFRTDGPAAVLSGNKPLLEQLIFSLLSNAIKSAGPEGAVEVSFLADHKRVLLSVWDSGPPIPEDRLSQLFAPQNLSGLPRPNEGAGLDLWLAQRVTVFHHGVIMASNRAQGGTEFTVSLPLISGAQLRFRSGDHYPSDAGFSSLLIGLADALPRQAFTPLEN